MAQSADLAQRLQPARNAPAVSPTSRTAQLEDISRLLGRLVAEQAERL
jgi:hypothetical protein